MAEADDTQKDNKGSSAKGKSKKLLILLLIPLLAAGGGAAGYMGLIKIPFLQGEETVTEDNSGPEVKDLVFVPLPKIVIPLGENAKAKYLRAQFSIETRTLYKERITTVKPRLMDMLNTYLRAVNEEELTDPARFQRLQAQMLRRARLVAGDEAVRNILVQEFVLQ